MNSPIEMEQAQKLAEKLSARTQEGKISWNVGDGSILDEASYSVQLDSGLVAVIAKQLRGKSSDIALSLKEKSGIHESKEILKVTLEIDPPYGFDTSAERKTASQFADLFEYARRSALKYDKKVDRALDYLDKLAV